MTTPAPAARSQTAVGTAKKATTKATAAETTEAAPAQQADPPGEMPARLAGRGWTLKGHVDAEGRFQCANTALNLTTNPYFLPQQAIEAAERAQKKYDAKHLPEQIAGGVAETNGKGHAVAREFSQPLKVRLSPDGLQEKCAEYDQKCAEKEALEAEFKKVHDQYKEDLKVKESEVQQLSAVIRKQSVEVETECQERFYYDLKLVRVVRLDTEETISEREMTAVERQEKLPSL